MADFNIPKKLLSKFTFQTIQVLLGVLTTLLLLINYSPNSVGNLSILMLYSGALDIFFSFRSEVVLTSGQRSHMAFLFKISINIFILSLFAYSLSYIFNFNIWVFSVLLFFSGLRVQNLMILHGNNESTLIYGVFVLLRPTLVILALLFSTPLIETYLITIAITGVTAVLFMRSCKLSSNATNATTFLKDNKTMLIRGLPASVLNYFSANIIQTILTLTGRTALLGTYAVANRLFLFGQSALSSALTHEMMSDLKRKLDTEFNLFKRYFIFGLFACITNALVFLLIVRFGGKYCPNNWKEILDWSIFFIVLASVKLTSVHLSYFMAHRRFRMEFLVNIILVLFPTIVLLVEDSIEYYVVAQTLVYASLIVLYGYLAQAGDKDVSNC